MAAGLLNTTGTNNTVIGANANVNSNNLDHATAIGADSVVSTFNTIALGRSSGLDKVVIYGLGTAGSTQLCRNASNQISGCSSSLRYKTNLVPFIGGLDVINRLHPLSFSWKGDGQRDVGFGAEEVAEVEPLLTFKNSQGQVEGVKYDRLSVVFVNAFKEQQQEINSLKSQVVTQQSQIEALKKMVCLDHPTAEVCK